MSLCALILAHHEPALLGRLTHRLRREGVRSYVHLDARVDAGAFTPHLAPDAVPVADRRVVFWGGFSMVEATWALLRAAMPDGHQRFLHISGDSYPIGPLQPLLADCDWIDVGAVDETDPLHDRIARTFMPDTALGGLSHREWYASRWLDDAALAQWDDARRAHAIKAAGRFPLRYAKGSNWWCLRRATLDRCRRALEERPELLDWFRFSAHPDESFFNTLALNFAPDPARRGTPVFALWDREPKPYAFRTAADLALLPPDGFPLARKVTDEAAALLDAPHRHGSRPSD